MNEEEIIVFVSNWCKRLKQTIKSHFHAGVNDNSWMAGFAGLVVGRALSHPSHSTLGGMVILVIILCQFMQSAYAGHVEYNDDYLRFLCLGACIGACDPLPLWPILALCLAGDYASTLGGREPKARTPLQLRWRRLSRKTLQFLQFIP